MTCLERYVLTFLFFLVAQTVYSSHSRLAIGMNLCCCPVFGAAFSCTNSRKWLLTALKAVELRYQADLLIHLLLFLMRIHIWITAHVLDHGLMELVANSPYGLTIIQLYFIVRSFLRSRLSHASADSPPMIFRDLAILMTLEFR